MIDISVWSEDCLPKPLPKSEINSLLEDYKNNNNLQAKEKIIQHNLRMLVRYAQKYCHDTNYIDDYIQHGLIAMSHAIDLYDPNNESSAALITYMGAAIENQLRRDGPKIVKQQADVSLQDVAYVFQEGDDLLFEDVIELDEPTLLEALVHKETIDQLYYFIQHHCKEDTQELLTLKFGLYDTDPIPACAIRTKMGCTRQWISVKLKTAYAALQRYLTTGKIPKRKI